MAKPTPDADDVIAIRHTLTLYRLVPRSPRGGRPPKEPRQLVWQQDNIAPEALDALEKVFLAGLGPGCILERDGVVIAEGPKLEEKPARVELSGYIPAQPTPQAELVECIAKGTATPEVLATLTTASPSEAVRFSLDVLWETYQRTVHATEDLISRGERHLEKVMKQQEWFIGLLQKNGELELELRALQAEESVKEAERQRARAERAEARPEGPRVADELLAALKKITDYIIAQKMG